MFPRQFSTHFFPLKLQVSCWLANSTETLLYLWFHKPAFSARRTQKNLPATLLFIMKLAIIVVFVIIIFCSSLLYDTCLSLHVSKDFFLCVRGKMHWLHLKDDVIGFVCLCCIMFCDSLNPDASLPRGLSMAHSRPQYASKE